MFGIGLPELVLIFVVALLVVGPKRLPEVARTLGGFIKNLRATSDDIHRAVLDADQPPLPLPKLGKNPREYVKNAFKNELDKLTAPVRSAIADEDPSSSPLPRSSPQETSVKGAVAQGSLEEKPPVKDGIREEPPDGKVSKNSSQ